MSPVFIAAVLPEFVVVWLTPVCLVGLGVLFGLILLGLVWGAGFALRPIPGLRESVWMRLAVAGGSFFLLLLLALIVSIVTAAPIPWIAAIVLSAIVSFGLAAVVKGPEEVPATIWEGAMGNIFVLIAIFAICGAFYPLVVENPGEILSSLTRLPYTGTETRTIEVPSKNDEGNPVKVEISVVGEELKSFRLKSDEELTVTLPHMADDLSPPTITTEPRRDSWWFRDRSTLPPVEDGELTQILVHNTSQKDAELEIELVTAPAHEEAAIVPVTAIVILVLVLLYVIQRAFMPRVSAVALATAKSEMAQLLYLIVAALGIVVLLICFVLPYNTFGEDMKMFKLNGLELVLLGCLIVAIWGAGTSVAEEIEGRTALTVLSKPIGRMSFVMGKFLGIVWSTGFMFLLLGGALFVFTPMKVVWDPAGAGSAVQAPTWEMCFAEMVSVAPGLALVFLEVVVMAAISVAISTRLSVLPNFLICIGVYALGHLTPLMVEKTGEGLELVRFFSGVVATILPNFEIFTVEAAVLGGSEVPYHYLLWPLLYCCLYGAFALLLALVLFEDRDLA